MIKTVLFIIALSFSLNFHAQKSFEGVITFSTSISTSKLAPPDFNAYLNAKYGDSLVMYYSGNGDFKRVHKNSSETEGADSQLYLAKTGMIYFTSKSKQLDSANVAVNSVRFIKRTKVANEKIMGLDCECYKYDVMSDIDPAIITYCFSKKTLRVNPALFTKHADFFLNEFYKMAERPYLKFSFETDEFKLTYIAHDLKAQSINKGLFRLK